MVNFIRVNGTQLICVILDNPKKRVMININCMNNQTMYLEVDRLKTMEEMRQVGKQRDFIIVITNRSIFIEDGLKL